MLVRRVVCGALVAGAVLTGNVISQQAQPGRQPRTLVATPDCNQNGILDFNDIASGRSLDCNGNSVPDECDLGSAVIFSESFENGLSAEWLVSDPWHITDQCPRNTECAGPNHAYFGFDDACDFVTEFFDPPFGTLRTPWIDVPAAATYLELSFCSAYEGEGTEPYDSADIFVEGQDARQLEDHVSPLAQLDWEARTLDLSAYAGQTIRISWVFNAMDGAQNNFLGWQIDDVRLTAFGIGTSATDCNQNGVLDECEPDCNLNGVPDVCEGLDCNLNGLLDSCEIAMGINLDCNLNSIPDDCDVSISLPTALENLEVSHPTMTSFFPDTFNFYGGQAGTCITNGGFSGVQLFKCGNTLSTNLQSLIPYTNSTVTPAAGFGPDASYFTAKYDGLFVLAAVDCSIDSFQIGGLTATGGQGVVDGLELALNVDGDLYTIYVKRVFDTLDPSVNQLIIVPGDGTGMTHSFPADTSLANQVLEGLAGIDRLYSVVVSRYGLAPGGGAGNVGLPLRPIDAKEIARELILSMPAPISVDADGNGIPDECE